QPVASAPPLESLAGKPYRERLIELLASDLDFHERESKYATHNFHSFPAKFPPQLPRKFILGLTEPGDTVLDPMAGSGTTIVESFLSGRKAMGFDIDPLALRIAEVKVTPLVEREVRERGERLLEKARRAVAERREALTVELNEWWELDRPTRTFIEEWFHPSAQVELLALRNEIQQIVNVGLRAFFEVVLSATIITKTGGVSLALDLAHTRPHKAKVLLDNQGQVLSGHQALEQQLRNIRVHTKTLRSPLDEFSKRLEQNVRALPQLPGGLIPAEVRPGDARALPLAADTADLIVTSPPYAANAIDYMRAHKFSLVWLGHPLATLTRKRQVYIGSETGAESDLIELPREVAALVAEFAGQDRRKGRALHLYYSDMTRALREMFRVCKPGRGVVLVVGNSTMRGRDTETQNCLAAIAAQIGFDVPRIGVRNLDRDRRMMPAGNKVNLDSLIQQRMHVEYVIGLYKPDNWMGLKKEGSSFAPL
ncbi:MAG: DNA methyltransferase, partial [Anaerolineae bacterium]